MVLPTDVTDDRPPGGDDAPRAAVRPERPKAALEVLVATLIAVALPTLAFALRFDSVEAAARSIDFNGGLFEDFLGPYWRTAQTIAAGGVTPDPQYVYPATLGVLLAPLTRLGDGAASWIALAVVVGSVLMLVAAARALRPPERGLRGAVGLGLLFAASFPVVHGAHWANASLPAAALASLGWILALRDRPGIGGALVGCAAALKLTPLAVLAGLALLGKRRACAAAAGSFVVFAVAVPSASLGAGGLEAFTDTALEQLRTLRAGVLDRDGAGSQDLPSRLVAWTGGALPRGAALAASLAMAVALGLAGARALRREGARRAHALPLLLAIPVLAVAPTWPHALAWLPLALWLTRPAGASAARKTTWCAAALASSWPLAWALGDPVDFIGSGALTLAALASLGLLVVPSRASVTPDERAASVPR